MRKRPAPAGAGCGWILAGSGPPRLGRAPARCAPSTGRTGRAPPHHSHSVATWSSRPAAAGTAAAAAPAGPTGTARSSGGGMDSMHSTRSATWSRRRHRRAFPPGGGPPPAALAQTGLWLLRGCSRSVAQQQADRPACAAEVALSGTWALLPAALSPTSNAPSAPSAPLLQAAGHDCPARPSGPHAAADGAAQARGPLAGRCAAGAGLASGGWVGRLVSCAWPAPRVSYEGCRRQALRAPSTSRSQASSALKPTI